MPINRLMSTLYSFGCSYTNLRWTPTWADWLSTAFCNFYNYGRSGAGNRYIFNQLMSVIHKHQVSKHDTVVIAWSTPLREDRYINGDWISLGNIYNQNYYPADWVKRYFDPFMGLMETINYADATVRILDSIGCKYYITWLMVPNKMHNIFSKIQSSSFVDFCDPDDLLKSHLNDVLSHDRVSKDDIFSFTETYEQTHNLSKSYHPEGTLDSHPTPLSAYMYTKDVLCPVLGIDNFDKLKNEHTLAAAWQQFLSLHPKIRLKHSVPDWPRVTQNF